MVGLRKGRKGFFFQDDVSENAESVGISPVVGALGSEEEVLEAISIEAGA